MHSPAARPGLLVLAGILFALLLSAAGATAAPLSGSGYDSQDGDQLTDPVLGTKDWNDVAGSTRLTTNLDKQATDDCFIGGVKENTPNDWDYDVSAGGCVPGKSDLVGMWSQSELTPTQSILHAAFVRTDSTGNTFLTFELNQAATKWTNAKGVAIPCRSTGDLLLAYDVGGGTVSVTLYRWTGDGTGPAACPNGANGSFAASPAANNGLTNSASITNFLSPATVGATIPAGKFGEAQIDVGAVLRSMGITGCFSYIQAQAHTRSSSSISSALIDNVPPVATKVANCAAEGTVYDDTDGNGVRGPSEPGLAGAIVYVDLDGDAVRDEGEPFATTDAAGAYVIPTGLSSGTHPTRVVVPSRAVCTQPAGTCAYNQTYTSTGLNATGRVFGLHTPASVSGRVYLDVDGDGTRDAAESATIAGTQVFDDVDGDGVLDAGEPQTTVAADGTYVLSGLTTGAHTLRAALPAGFKASGTAAHAVTLASGEAVTGRDFGGYRDAEVRGHLFDDADGDGAHQPGEAPISGQTVRLLLDGTATVVATTSTGADGSYAFAGLAPGAYVVDLQLSGGRVCSSPVPCTRTATVTSGELSGDQVFTAYLPARLSGTVRDVGDASGIAGRTVTLDAGADGTPDGTTTTGSDGSYAFEGLAPGTYRVTIGTPAGWTCNTPDPCRHTRTLASGAASSGNDFGQARVPVADLSMTKSAPATVVHEDTFSYTLTATNAGPDTAVAAKVVDELPDGVEFVSASAGCTEADGTVTCDLGDVAAGSAPAATITVRATTPGPVDNTATVSSQTGDPDPSKDSDSAAVTVTPAADLEFDKRGPASVAAGATATYTLEATNRGPSSATGVVLRDTLPAGMVFDADASDAGWTQTAPGVYELAVGTIADGATVSKVLAVRAPHALGGSQLTNAGSVVTETDDPVAGNDEDAVTTGVGPSADLEMTKTAGAPDVAYGGTVTYTLRVANAGPTAAEAVSVTDALPAGLEFVSLAQTSGPAFDCTSPAAGAGGTVECSRATLADGAAAVFEVVARGDAPGDRVNTAAVTSTTPDGDPADNSDAATVKVGPASDLELEKSASAAAVTQGEELTYTLKVSNRGPSGAAGVEITDPLPAGMRFKSASAGCVNADGTVTCDLGGIADGESRTVTVTVTATGAGTQVNTATVASDTPDPDTSQNDATATVEVGPAADLRIAKSGPATVQAGGELRYTLTASNDGPSAATGVVVADDLPEGLQYVGAAAGAGTCTEAGGRVVCSLGTLADGASATVTIDVRAPFSLAGRTVSNTATIDGDRPDPDPADDAATHDVAVGSAADLVMTKSAPGKATAGGRLVYDLRVENKGPQAAEGVQVVDVLPDGLTFVSAEPTQGACSAAAGTVTCAIGDVPPAGAAGVRLTVDVAASLGGKTVRNRAEATSKTTETDAATNAGEATTAVDEAPKPAVPEPVEERKPDVPRAAEPRVDAAPPAPEPAALECTDRRLVLVDVYERKGRVQLLGAADRKLVGQTVNIVFEATRKVVAKATVAADGSFRTTAPLPARALRASNEARYMAVVGKERSLNLKLARRLIVESMTARGGKVTIAGRVTGPLAKGAQRRITVKRRVSCTRMETVGTFKPRADGRYSITVAAPTGTKTAVYRLNTRVRRTAGNAKTYPTFTLQRPVNLFGS